MHRLRHPMRRWAVLGGSMLIGMLAVVLFTLLWPTSTWARASELAQAEQRWSLRTFGRYSVHLIDKRCAQRIEVRNERVVSVLPNRCDVQPRTVSDLFDLIRRDGSISHPCIFQGCACDDILLVQATYHPELGYPQRVLVRVRATPNWRHPEFWQRAWATRQLPTCNALAEGSKIIQVVSITPR
jgi:hypothetical protein